MTDLEEAKQLLREALDHWGKWMYRDESDSNLTIMASKVKDALALLEQSVLIDKAEWERMMDRKKEIDARIAIRKEAVEDARPYL